MLPAKAQQKYEVINDGTKYLIVFPVSSTSTEISNPMIGLRKSHFEDYINCLRKYKSKAQEWEKSAQEVGVTNYEKPFKSPREKGTLLNIKRVYYTVEGQTYYNIYDYMGFSPLYMTPYFHVDEQGECFIYLKASVGRKNLETGNIYKSTSTALESTTTTEYTQIDIFQARKISILYTKRL